MKKVSRVKLYKSTPTSMITCFPVATDQLESLNFKFPFANHMTLLAFS